MNGVDGDGSGGAGGTGGTGGTGGNGGTGGAGSFSQAEVDALVAQKLKQFDGVDVAEYRSLKEAKTKKERDDLEKKGDFDKILAQTMKEKDDVISVKDGEIAALGEKLREIKVDSALLSAASAAKAINPAQIVTLLKGSVYFDQKTGVVEVRENGAPSYRGGKPVTVDLFVQEFLQANNHFLPAGPAGSGSQGSGGGQSGKSSYQITKTDAKDPAKYRVVRDLAMKEGKTVEIVQD